jgi:hypothetical protein
MLALQEEGSTPSLYEVFVLLQEVVRRQAKIDERLGKLERSNPPQIRKGVLELLDGAPKPSVNVEEWFGSLDIPDETLSCIVNGDYVAGTSAAIVKMVTQSGTVAPPIVCPSKKENTVFGFYSGAWKEMTSSDFSRLLDVFSRRLMGAFKSWQDEMGDAIYSEKGSRLYHMGVQKVMGGMSANDSVRARIRARVYRGLKVDLKSKMEST